MLGQIDTMVKNKKPYQNSDKVFFLGSKRGSKLCNYLKFTLFLSGGRTIVQMLVFISSGDSSWKDCWYLKNCSELLPCIYYF